MSDLISRSELLKRFCINKDGHRIPERDCDNFEVTVSVKDIKTIIKEQPTAYDVDNVVEKLEKLKDKGSVTKTEKLITKSCIDNAIEIVKQGGISDDRGREVMDEEDYCYCHYHDDTYEYFDCLDYMECEECPYYYADED